MFPHTGAGSFFFVRSARISFGKITPAKAGDRITPRRREKKKRGKKEVSGTIALCTRSGCCKVALPCPVHKYAE